MEQSTKKGIKKLNNKLTSEDTSANFSNSLNELTEWLAPKSAQGGVSRKKLDFFHLYDMQDFSADAKIFFSNFKKQFAIKNCSQMYLIID